MVRRAVQGNRSTLEEMTMKLEWMSGQQGSYRLMSAGAYCRAILIPVKPSKDNGQARWLLDSLTAGRVLSKTRKEAMHIAEQSELSS